MLIDIDNANYSKKEEEEESPSIIKRDPRLSDTVISSNPFPASSKPRLQPIPEDAPEVRVPSTSTKQEETITPNTCFDGYSSSELMALCAKYKKRVIDEGRSEDVEILLNINSVGGIPRFSSLGHLAAVVRQCAASHFAPALCPCT